MARLDKVVYSSACLMVLLGASLTAYLHYLPKTKASVPTPSNPLHFSSQGHEHNQLIIPTYHYNSTPPTSGPHDEVYPMSTISNSPIRVAAFVHMLEHGNVIIVYNDIPNSELTTLKNWVLEEDGGKNVSGNELQERSEQGKLVFLSPWPSIHSGEVDAVAWTRLLPLKGVDTNQLKDFVHIWLGNKQNIAQ